MIAADLPTRGLPGFASVEGKGVTSSANQSNKSVTSRQRRRSTPRPCSGMGCYGGTVQGIFGTGISLYPDVSPSRTAPTIQAGECTTPFFFFFFFWTGLRDPIACSIVVGGIPTQNSGYESTRLCMSVGLVCEVP